MTNLKNSIEQVKGSKQESDLTIASTLIQQHLPNLARFLGDVQQMEKLELELSKKGEQSYLELINRFSIYPNLTPSLSQSFLTTLNNLVGDSLQYYQTLKDLSSGYCYSGLRPAEINDMLYQVEQLRSLFLSAHLVSIQN